MSNIVAIVGESGSGKTTSAYKLDPKTTGIISIEKEELPFPGFKKNYTRFDSKEKKGNFLYTGNPKVISDLLKHISKDREDIGDVLIDDMGYMMTQQFMSRTNELGFQKWTDIGKSVWDTIQSAKSLREDLNIFFTFHSETVDENGKAKKKIKTLGKLLDQNVYIEGIFNTVLFTNVSINENDEPLHQFMTKTDGVTTAKSPMEMFKDMYIPNDLAYVSKRIREYQNGEVEE